MTRPQDRRPGCGRDNSELGPTARLRSERFAAAALGDHVRVLDLEAGGLQAVLVVEFAPADVVPARRVDEHAQPVVFDNEVVVFRFRVEPHPVREACAAALLDEQSKPGHLRVEALILQSESASVAASAVTSIAGLLPVSTVSVLMRTCFVER